MPPFHPPMLLITPKLWGRLQLPLRRERRRRSEGKADRPQRLVTFLPLPLGPHPPLVLLMNRKSHENAKTPMAMQHMVLTTQKPRQRRSPRNGRRKQLGKTGPLQTQQTIVPLGNERNPSSPSIRTPLTIPNSQSNRKKVCPPTSVLISVDFYFQLYPTSIPNSARQKPGNSTKPVKTG